MNSDLKSKARFLWDQIHDLRFKLATLVRDLDKAKETLGDNEFDKVDGMIADINNKINWVCMKTTPLISLHDKGSTSKVSLPVISDTTNSLTVLYSSDKPWISALVKQIKPENPTYLFVNKTEKIPSGDTTSSTSHGMAKRYVLYLVNYTSRLETVNIDPSVRDYVASKPTLQPIIVALSAGVDEGAPKYIKAINGVKIPVVVLQTDAARNNLRGKESQTEIKRLYDLLH